VSDNDGKKFLMGMVMVDHNKEHISYVVGV
jgi:hypothetical protein